MPKKPLQPDYTSQPDRYRAANRYGFFLEVPGDTIDDIIDAGPEKFLVLRLNPQSINVREPIATSVTMTQGGGKYVESRGMVIKQFSVQGTTGYLPISEDHRVLAGVETDTTIHLERSRGNIPESIGSIERDKQLMAISGFKAFYQLRHMFRLFGHERRVGNPIRMHYMDFKGDDYWRIEPSEFGMVRNSRRPFLYDYQIYFQGIEPSEFAQDLSNLYVPGGIAYSTAEQAMEGIQNTRDTGVTLLGRGSIASAQKRGPVGTPLDKLVGGGVKPDPAAATFTARMKQMATNGLASLRYFSGTVQQKFQGLLTKVGEVTSFLDDAKTTTKSLLVDTPLVLLKQLNGQIDGLFDAVDAFGSDTVKEELNEFLLELRFLTDQLTAHHITVFADRPGDRIAKENDKFTIKRGASGSTRDLIVEDSASTGSVSGNPALGTTGLDLLGGLAAATAANTFETVRVLYGENIFDVSRRVLGSPHLYYQIVVLNNLRPPYIVSDAANKLPGVVAWNESLRVPSKQSSQLNAVDGKPIGSPSPIFTGTVSVAGTSTQLIDDDRFDTWRENQLVGFTVTMTSGAALGASRVIVANTDTGTMTVSRAWSVTPSVGDEFEIEDLSFSLRVKPTAETIAFGKDILAKFDSRGKADAVLGTKGDLVGVSGRENFEQAMLLMMNTEFGSNMFHRLYGVGLPIGRPARSDTLLIYTFFARQSLRSDPRVDTVENPKMSYESGTFRFKVDVKPVRFNNATTFNIAR